MLIAPAFIESAPFYRLTFQLTLTCVGAGLILAAIMRLKWRGPVALAFAYVGARSYSIYLWHVPMKRWGVPVLLTGTNLDGYALQVAYVALSVLAGIVMAAAIEAPALVLRDRIFPSDGGSQAPGALRNL
jgi:peptidoglycan/LPS O-acetylase OafA/YrhL